MAEKLKSILRTTPWSLIAKTGFFAGAWLFFPYWLFVLSALALYFVPWFRPAQLALPFGLTLVFAALLLPNPGAAFLLGAIFFLIMGIKDLILVKRDSAYEALIFLIFFLLALNFFSDFESPFRAGVLASSLGLGLLYALLAYPLRHFAGIEGPGGRSAFAFGLGGFLLWQWSLALVFLPMNYFFQAALFFLGTILVTELLLEHLKGTLGRSSILVHFSIFFTLLAVILAANRWSV